MNEFKSWIIANFDEGTLCDLAKNGAQNGFEGLIYDDETSELYKNHKDEIWKMLGDDGEDYGESILKMISHFRGANEVFRASNFETLLVWYAAEKVANQLIEA